MKFSSLPRAAYVHVPFCRHRCGYCNFPLIAGRDDLIDAYLQAIARELSRQETRGEVDTLYFGGGTPSHLSVEQFARLADSVLNALPLAIGCEWTVEANPADVTGDRIRALRQLGVTRLSLGGQSFQDDKLWLLERDHQAADIRRAVTEARDAGLAVALDLIFATPGEALTGWFADLASAIALAPDHLSTYGLTYERGTRFDARRRRGELSAVDEEAECAMYESAIDQLTAAGWEHYEVSNFARPGQRSRHNQVYWTGDGYWGFGPGAARYVDGIRETNHRSTTTYLKRVLGDQSPVAEREVLTPEARARELLVIGLRRLEGVQREEFCHRTGIELDALAGESIRRFQAQGLLEDMGTCVRLTRAGLLVSDALWPELL